jgi:hypothetical protein
MYRLLFRWAFNDFLLLRLLASFSAASSRTKVQGAAHRPQSIWMWNWDVKTASVLLNPLPVLDFSQSF